MRLRKLVQAVLSLAISCIVLLGVMAGAPMASDQSASIAAESQKSDQIAGDESSATPKPAAEITGFLSKGIEWLIAAQHPDGGWGGGSHANQQNRDPHQVKTDPGTTAFTLMSLLRAGHTPVGGKYEEQVRRGLEYLIVAVEKAPVEGPRITDLTGTQPQSKLGPNVDTPLTAQYLARALKLLPQDDVLYERTDATLSKCLEKLQASQEEDGGWGRGGGWAPVLQSSLGCSALEIAQATGKAVDEGKLRAAREFQRKQVEVTGGRAVAKTDASAGIELYAFNGALRGNAVIARSAEVAIETAKVDGKLPQEAVINQDNLRRIGFSDSRAQSLAQAAEQNAKQLDRLNDENLLAGFGNNSGEEFLSYLLTSESLVIAGGEKFHTWNDKIHGRLQKIQNTDGSWSGHHCITSPVFCTAAVVQCLTTDRDAEFLIAMAERSHSTDENKAEVAQQ